MNGYVEVYYCVYPLLLMGLTLALARTLYRAGAAGATLRDWEGGNLILRRLAIGLVMVSAGYLALTFLMNTYFVTMQQVIDAVLTRLGFGVMLLGTVFTFDLLVLAVWTRGGRPRIAHSSELR